MKSITYATSVSSVRTVRKMIWAQALRWRARDGHIGSSQVHDLSQRGDAPNESNLSLSVADHRLSARHLEEGLALKRISHALCDGSGAPQPRCSAAALP
jgi:hypothetical protein